jgi:metal-responsive CopG/Arc/MetJ family transcriptional regulator
MQITLPPEIAAEVDRIALRDGVSRDDVVREAVREFLDFHRFRDLRARMVAEAQAQGLFTDEQVFDRIS